MKRYISTIITTLALMMGLTMLAAPAYADTSDIINSNNAACQGNTSVCSTSGGRARLFGIIKNIINLLLVAAGVISVIIIIVGGLRYTLSAGDQAQVTAAKNTVMYAVVGLVVAMLSFAIVNFVVARIF